MIKAVLFDLDGTLVNSLEDLANAVNFALSKSGLPMHELSEFNYFVGDGIPKLIERSIPENLRTAAEISNVKDLFFKHYSVHYADNTRVYEGINELVLSLKKMGIKIGVVSNKAQDMAERVVKTALGDIFDLVYGMRENIPPKPNPKLTFSALEKLGVRPEECIFMGDSGMDMAVAVNCGAFPIGVLWGFRTKEELTENGAKRIIKKPMELLDIIGDLD